MALNKIPNPPTVLIDDTDWTTFVSRSGYGMIGHGLSIPIFTLTQWESGALIPEIATGSIIEVGGSFYQADSDTALTADVGLIDGTVRIKLVPAGGGATVTPTITSDPLPAWSAPKGGWYDSDDKFLPHIMTKSGTSYTGKGVFVDQDANIKFFIDGAADFDGAVGVGGSLSVTSGATIGGNTSVTGNITATGDLFFGGAYRTKYQQVSLSANEALYVARYTTATSAVVFVTVDSGPAYGNYRSTPTLYTLNNTSGATTTESDTTLMWTYSAGAGTSADLQVKAEGEVLYMRLAFNIASPVFTVNLLILEKV